MKPLVELEFMTAGTIYDPVTPIPVGAAREIAFSGPVTIAFENVPLGGPLDGMKPGRLLRVRDLEFSQQGPSAEEVALMFGVRVEPDPNAAMIARDEPKFATGGYVAPKCRYELDPMEFFKPSIFDRLGGHDGKKKFRAKFGGKSKPAITGLTTVHDGKVNGLGFCSDLGHE